MKQIKRVPYPTAIKKFNETASKTTKSVVSESKTLDQRKLLNPQPPRYRQRREELSAHAFDKYFDYDINRVTQKSSLTLKKGKSCIWAESSKLRSQQSGPISLLNRVQSEIITVPKQKRENIDFEQYLNYRRKGEDLRIKAKKDHIRKIYMQNAFVRKKKSQALVFPAKKQQQNESESKDSQVHGESHSTHACTDKKQINLQAINEKLQRILLKTNDFAEAKHDLSQSSIDNRSEKSQVSVEDITKTLEVLQNRVLKICLSASKLQQQNRFLIDDQNDNEEFQSCSYHSSSDELDGFEDEGL